MWYLENIPRVVHLYWGNDTISFLRYLTVLSFKKFNPDWQIKLYFPKIRYQGDYTWSSVHQKVEFRGGDYIDKLLDMEIDKIEIDFAELGINDNIPETFKSDFLRWYILSTEGGLWSDFDIIYFKPISHLYVNQEVNKDVNTLICFNKDPGYHSIGFLMSSPDNEFYKFIYEKSHISFDLQEYQSIGYNLLNEQFPDLASIKNKCNNINLANLKLDVVYPLDHNRIPYIYYGNHTNYITTDTIGIHWYGGHPEAGKFENLLTENNFYAYDNVISKIIAEII